MIPLSLEAPAKLNLSLRIVGSRGDGYHLLESEMVLLDLADRLLLLSGSTGLRVEAEPGEEVPLDRGNLAWRGLRVGLAAEPEMACLALEKRIPVAAGLGGGSSDAAAAWRLGRRASGAAETPTAAELAELGTLGADVPFFAAGVGAARVTGIGEVVMPSTARESWAVLVVPDFRLATADVFAALRASDLASGGLSGNDLLAPARRLRPELDELSGLMADAGATPRLSGSGPTLFTLEDDPARAASIAERLRARGVGVIETRTRTRPAPIIELAEVPDEGGAPSPSMG